MLPEMAALQGQNIMPQQQPQQKIGGLLGSMGRHPWKTAAFSGLGGAAIGGLFGTHGGRNWLSELWSGKPGQPQQLPTQTPQGMQLLNQLMSQGMQNTDFGGIENLYKKQFNEETIPGLAERFSSMGQMGAQRGSEFQGALGKAGSDLGAQLAALRSQYGLKQSALGLTPQFENIYEGSTGGLNSTLGKMLPLLAAMGLGGI